MIQGSAAFVAGGGRTKGKRVLMGTSAERCAARKSFVAGRMLVVLAATALAMVFPASALGHVERASYWPDPAPDCWVDPCAGGEVPTARSLASAAYEDRGSRVVCQRDSLRHAQRSIETAQKTGYVLRPSLGPQTISSREGRALLDVNRKLFMHCRFRSIQEAVNASGNNDRVVIMPGLYTEPKSRAAPTFDPACDAIRDHRTTEARRARFPTSISSIAPTTRT